MAAITDEVPKYELAMFMASPEADAFASAIDDEWRKSGECSEFRSGVAEGDPRYSQKFAELFRSWLERRVRETGARSGRP